MSRKRELHLPKIVRDQQEAIVGRLKTLMNGRSQRGWARELGVPQQNISRYLTGTVPHLGFLIHLARREGVNLNWLALGEGKRFRTTKRLGG